MLFFNDYNDYLSKLSDTIDLSRSYDQRQIKLPVLGGSWDKFRNIRRG